MVIHKQRPVQSSQTTERHTGQDSTNRFQQRAHNLSSSRRLYTIHVLKQDETSLRSPLKIDVKLLTGELDEDIAILDLLV